MNPDSIPPSPLTAIALSPESADTVRPIPASPGGTAPFNPASPVVCEASEILPIIDVVVTLAAVIVAAEWMRRTWHQRRFMTPAAFPAFDNGHSPPKNGIAGRFDPNVVIAAVAAYFFVAASLSMFLSRDEQGLWTTLLIDAAARLAGTAVCLYAVYLQFAGGLRAFFLGGQAGTAHLEPPLPTAVRRILTGLLVGVVAIGLCPLVLEATVWFLVQVVPGFEPLAHPTITRLDEQRGDPAVVGALWVGAAVIAPVAEEVFFRGVLQTVLGNVLRRRGAAIIMASILFGVVHLGQPQAVPALVAMGLILGYAYERTGALLVPIAAHAAFNLKSLVWVALSAADGAPI